MRLNDLMIRRFRLATWAFLVAMGLYSVYLALNRIYQVDEAQNVFTARILASGWESSHHAWFGVWHLWPLSWFASWCQSSESMLHASRLFMLMVLWVNIFLSALACVGTWRHRKFLWILTGAATLVPLWDYGFEIRHDNLLLLGLLLGWVVLRAGTSRPVWRMITVGILAAGMQFTTFKAFVYWVPLLLVPIMWPRPEWNLRRRQVLLLVSSGFLACGTLLVLGLLAAGRFPLFLESLRVAFGVSLSPPTRVMPWGTIERWIQQTPILLAVVVAAAAHTGLRLRGAWSQESFWEGPLPEGCMLAVTLIPLMVHPMPLPYHLCLVVPFAFVFGVRWLTPHAGRWAGMEGALPLWGGLLLMCHAIPFWTYTGRHFSFSNTRQIKLIRLSEVLTHPAGRDRVFDAAGLVSARKSIGKQWFLHTLVLDQFQSGKLPAVREMLLANPAAVLLPNYRFGWLPAEDVDFIRKHYLMLAGDFLVLGQVIPSKEGIFDCIHGGEYVVASLEGGRRQTGELFLNGAKISSGSVQFLKPGQHLLRAEQGSTISVSWIGPNLKEMQPLGPGDSGRLFINWY